MVFSQSLCLKPVLNSAGSWFGYKTLLPAPVGADPFLGDVSARMDTPLPGWLAEGTCA